MSGSRINHFTWIFCKSSFFKTQFFKASCLFHFILLIETILWFRHRELLYVLQCHSCITSCCHLLSEWGISNYWDHASWTQSLRQCSLLMNKFNGLHVSDMTGLISHPPEDHHQLPHPLPSTYAPVLCWSITSMLFTLLILFNLYLFDLQCSFSSRTLYNEGHALAFQTKVLCRNNNLTFSLHLFMVS